MYLCDGTDADAIFYICLGGVPPPPPAPPTRTGLTLTVTLLEITVAGVPELSVTWSSNDQVPAVDRIPVEIVNTSPGLQEKELPRLL